MARLVWAGGLIERLDEDGQNYRCPDRYDLDDSDLTIVGRGKTSSLRIREKLVSRKHAEIVFSKGQWKVRDVSTNGTYVNGFRVNDSVLENDDYVAFGALGPLKAVGEFQSNYKECGTLFQFKIIQKPVSKPKKVRSRTAAAPSSGHRCEMCKKIHDGTWGSGRFCSQSCAAQYSRRRGSQASGSNKRRPRDDDDDADDKPPPKRESASSRRRRAQPKSRSQRAKDEHDDPQQISSGRGRRTRAPAPREELPELEPCPVKIKYPPPSERRERFFRPSMMTIHQGTKMYRVEARGGVRCYESKDITRYVRPEIIVRYGTVFPCDEKSGSWVRTGRLWLPIVLKGQAMLKEDKKQRKLHNKHVIPLFTTVVSKPAGRARKRKLKSSTEGVSREKKERKKDLKKKDPEPVCEICGKAALWGSGRFCGRSCAAKLAAIASNKRGTAYKKKLQSAKNDYYKG